MPSTQFLQSKLRQHFGFRRFRPGQAKAIASAMQGRDVVAIMPTGSGKSVCFQLPALELHGMTVVVSPLIALMKDQADQLREKGIAAVVLNSTLSASGEQEALAAIAAGKVEFVYVTPERLAKPETRKLLASCTIDLFVVDEAHCISHWGHDFRPDYLLLSEAITSCGRPPVLAMTATATQEVIDDIKGQLKIPEAEVVHTGFFRKNLSLRVHQCSSEEQKRLLLKSQLASAKGSGVVYAATVKAVEELAAFLASDGFDVGMYHGRMALKRRMTMQDDFMQGNLKTIIATNAFGLGIDKPDIRFVTHYHVPGTLEAYYQEFGRAGRDGQQAVGTLLFDAEDLKLQKFFQGGRFLDDAVLVNAYHAVEVLEKPASFKELEQSSPVRGAKLRQALSIFSAQGLVATDHKHRYFWREQGVPRELITRAAERDRERQHRDLAKLQALQAYAEKHQCRWQRILDYFESEELNGETCGACDVCAAQQAAKALAAPVVA